MSETDWTLIEELSRRFDQMLGISSPESLVCLRDNFHVVHLIANGDFDDILNEFFLSRSRDPSARAQLYEQLRHYELPAGGTRFLSALLETSGVKCDERIRYLIDRRLVLPEEGKRRVRCKLVRFSASVSLKEAKAACSRVGFVPARLPQLIQFADAYPDAIPEKLLAAGNTVSSRPEVGGLMGVPCLSRQGSDAQAELSFHIADGLETASIDPSCVLLVERVSLRDATGDTVELDQDGSKPVAALMAEMDACLKNLPEFAG